MYEYSAKRPAQEKKDSCPGSQANYLNAPENSGDKEFSLSDVRMRYDPQKTAQLKAHAFTQSSGGLKKASPRGVIQRTIWMYGGGFEGWKSISEINQIGTFPLPKNPKVGLFFNDFTGDHYSPGEPEYRNKFQEYMEEKSQQAKTGDYNYLNRLSAFAAAPHAGKIETPFDGEKIGSRVNKIGKNSYVVATKGAGKADLRYADISRAGIPKKAFAAAADYMSAPPGTPVVPYSGPLTDKQKAMASAFTVIQHLENRGAPTDGTLQIMAAKAAATHGLAKVIEQYPFAPPKGTKATRVLLKQDEDKDKDEIKEFSQEQADMFFRYAQSAPTDCMSGWE